MGGQKTTQNRFEAEIRFNTEIPQNMLLEFMMFDNIHKF